MGPEQTQNSNQYQPTSHRRNSQNSSPTETYTGIVSSIKQANFIIRGGDGKNHSIGVVRRHRPSGYIHQRRALRSSEVPESDRAIQRRGHEAVIHRTHIQTGHSVRVPGKQAQIPIVLDGQILNRFVFVGISRGQQHALRVMREFQQTHATRLAIQFSFRSEGRTESR
jgi:hypothetical protein